MCCDSEKQTIHCVLQVKEVVILETQLRSLRNLHRKCAAAVQLPELTFFTELEEEREKQGNIQMFSENLIHSLLFICS